MTCNRVRWSLNYLGLEVIQEETESQMSSSETEDELNNCVEFCAETLRQRKENGVNGFSSTVNDISPSSSEILEFSTNLRHSKEDDHDEIQVAKHIKIPSEWDPVSVQNFIFTWIEGKDYVNANFYFHLQKPMLARLYAMIEPKQGGVEDASAEIMAGHMHILSGNRRKGTFWNAWRRKFCILTTGKLTAYDVIFSNNYCDDCFHSLIELTEPILFSFVEK